MEYSGQLEIEGDFYDFVLKDYRLYVISKKNCYISNKTLNSIIENGWVTLQDREKNLLLIKIAEVHYKFPYERFFDVQAYIIRYNRAQTDNELTCNELILKSDVLDYFFKEDKCFWETAVYLLNEWVSNDNKIVKPQERQTLKLDLEGKSIEVQFKTMIQRDNTPFPFSIRNCMVVSGEELNRKETIWEVVQMVMLFLEFISQSSHINFVNPIIMSSGMNINEADTYMYICPDEKANIERERVFDYKDIEPVIGKLLMAIHDDTINFRSLFISNYEKITYSDIINVCAAFEFQFDKKNQKEFLYNEQRRIRRKMVKLLQSKRESEFDEEELPIFDEIIEGFGRYKDTLQKRIEKALEEFIDIYGSEDIKIDFEEDFLNMPKRIKDSRNALDHGNYQYKLQRIMYYDSELLRAIVYMLILKTVGLEDKVRLKHLLKKMSRYI